MMVDVKKQVERDFAAFGLPPLEDRDWEEEEYPEQ